MKKTIIKSKKPKACLYDILDYSEELRGYSDKIEIISLVHGTGQINLITTKGKEFRIKVVDLINELQLDQTKDIIERNCTIFQNILTIKYPDRRSNEYDRIVLDSRLNHISTKRSKLGCFEVMLQINNVPQEETISLLPLPPQQVIT